MAKKLNLQIKNAQLAEVLKKAAPKKTEEKPVAAAPAKVEEAQPKIAPKGRTVPTSIAEKQSPQAIKQEPAYKPKAKSAPSAYLEKKAKEEAAMPAPAPVEEVKEPQKPQEPQVQVEQKPAPTPAFTQAPVSVEPEVKVNEPVIEKKEAPAFQKQERPMPSQGPRPHASHPHNTQQRHDKNKPAAPAPQAAPASTAADARQDKTVKKPEFTPPRDIKDVKSVKKQAFQKTFDSRDRHGLRAGEEEAWRRKRNAKGKNPNLLNAEVRPKTLSVRPPITLKELASQMKIKASEIIEKLFKQGFSVTLNEMLDDTSIILVGDEFGCQITIDRSQEERLRVTEKSIKEEIASTDNGMLVSRAPVVAFMGHVDHGKTSLIDAIRKSKLAAAEAGAITQHIGAFRCHTKHGDITILDTPGHEAFSAIRSRGADVTDIIVIVIAGDEGIMPQTDEAIRQAQEAHVPIIVAINKADKPGFNPDLVLRQLADRSILAEAWGGDVITVNCSATTNQGIEELLEMLALQSEILELVADPTARARGTVLESEIQKGLGNTATLLIQNGTLRRGDAILFEHEYGRVKTMRDERGRHLTKALPSMAVEVTGLSEVPSAGCEFIVVGSEKEARKLAEERLAGVKRENLRKTTTTDLQSFFLQHAEKKEKKLLSVIVKADVKGSLEAIETMLLKIPSDKVRINIISSSVGVISESDVEWAKASNALILGFHTRTEPAAEDYAKKQGVKVLIHEVIYHLIDEVKEEMTKLLDKVRQENEVGSAQVKMVFRSSSHGLIAGCQIIDGIIKRSNIAKVFRGNTKVWEGEIQSLKRHQDDVREVSKGLECGILLSNFKDIQAGDVIKAFEVTYITQTL